MTRDPFWSDLLGYYALRGAGGILRRLPIIWTLRLGARLGEIAYLAGIRRERVEANLKQAFPESPEHRRVRIAREAYREVGMNMLELIGHPDPRSPSVRRWIQVEGRDILDSAMARGKGAILVSAHFGSWDAATALIPVLWPDPSVVVRHQRCRLLGVLYESILIRRGWQVLRKKRSIPGGYGALEQGRLLVLVADQDARSHGLFIPFFGRPASTLKGPALFAVRTGAPLVFGRVERGSDPRRRTICFDAMEMARAEAPEDEEVRRLTRRYVRWLERIIRKRPEHYFWFHHRWKTQPPNHDRKGS